jgi:hypothetical protein
MAGGGNTLVRNVSSGAVAAIAAWSSYSHMVHLALRYGERPEVAYALPFSVDGMLIASTIVMVDDKRHGRRVRPMARLAFTVGVIASIAANIAAAPPTLGARLIDAWPAVALLLVVEMLARPPAAATPAAPPVQPPTELLTTTPRLPRQAEVPPAVSPGTEGLPLRQVAPLAVTEVQPAVPPHVEVAPPPSSRVDIPPVRPAHVAPAYPSRLADRPAAHRRLHGAATSADAMASEHPYAGELPVATYRRLNGQTAEPPAAEVRVPAELRRDATTTEGPVHRSRSLAAAALAGPTPAKEPTGELAHRAAPDRIAATAAGRRPTATTRRLAQTMMAAEPHLSRTEVANRLGVSTRRLREVLAG